MATNEWGQIEQAMVAKLIADYGPGGTTPRFRLVAAVPEEVADDFPTAFPACLISFAGAFVTNRNARQTVNFASAATGNYVALIYAQSGSTDDRNRYDLGTTPGIYELEKLVRNSLMGHGAGVTANLDPAPLFWMHTEQARKIAKEGTGILKMRTTFEIEQIVGATAT